MNRFVIIFILFLFHLNLFGQHDLKGIVLGNGYAKANVEVVNITKKIVKKTDDKGKFLISAAVGDVILFAAKDYNEKKVKLNQEHFNSEIVFQLEIKAVELKEIEIAGTEKLKVGTSYEALKMEKLAREENQPKVVGVFTGEIDKGIDFVEIGNKIIKLLDKQLAPKGEVKNTESFKKYVRREFSNEFFITKLNLKENEIDPFIVFCENDLKSRDITQQNGVLDVLEFMLDKRKDFKN
ncbi:hypothetical protein ABGT15_06175 [Flavobacterium enshiense]|uniref:hypothetical protein n=1 Tax=Flavobacterium enshiense TaxID=1341165 RepID=UPI00345D4685